MGISNDTPSRATRRWASIVAALVLAACGTTAPTASPIQTVAVPATLGPQSPPPATPGTTPSPALTQPPAQVYATIESQVEQIRELQAKDPIDPKILDEAALSKLIETSFREDNPPASVKANEDLLKHLGLIPQDASLEGLYVRLLSSQVAGLYRPQTKQLYVVSRAGGLGPVERTTFAHEFTHALQDQNFGIQKLGVDTIGQGDRSLARLSLVEGDATLSMSLWTQQNLTPAETLQLLAASSDPQQLQVLTSMPPILRDSLLFPYRQGLQFVLGLRTSGGWDAVDKAFATPPDSTEQIFHPALYQAHQAPIKVAVPRGLAAILGSNWKVALEDTLGEFELRIWLRDVARLSEAQADSAAEGWGGDRVVLLDGPDGHWALALLSAWDSAADATEFAGALQAMIGSGVFAVPPTIVHRDGGSTVEVVLAGDAASESTLSATFAHDGG